jgi:hypothetical protein
LISFYNDIDIPPTPDDKPKGPEDEESGHKTVKDFLPLWAQIKILEKIEFIEGNK